MVALTMDRAETRARTPNRPAVVGQAAACAGLGAVIGLLGVYAHLVVLGAARLPVGLVLALVLLLASTVTVRALGVDGLGRSAMAFGWMVGVLMVGTVRRREGDLLMVVSAPSVLLLLVGAIVLTLNALAPLGRRGGRGR